jgi:hypothetical protein
MTAIFNWLDWPLKIAVGLAIGPLLGKVLGALAAALSGGRF